MNIYELILIFISQYAFQYFRLVGIKHGVNGNMFETIKTTFIMQTLWLATMYFGVMSLVNKDWIAVTIYMIGGIVGAIHAVYKVRKINKKDK